MKPQPFVNNNKKEELTPDALIKEALIAGVSFFDVYDYTFGELVEIVNADFERTRRQNKDQALFVMREAELVSLYLAGEGKDLRIYDIFPFWTAEEKKEMLLNEYKNKMIAIAAKGV